MLLVSPQASRVAGHGFSDCITPWTRFALSKSSWLKRTKL